MAIGAIGGAISGYQKADAEKSQAQAQLKQTSLDRQLLQQQTDQSVNQFRTQQAQVERQSGRMVEKIGRQEAGVLGGQSAQAGKVGLAGAAGSFAGMQSQVRKQAAEDVSRTQEAAMRDREQLEMDIRTTKSMADVKKQQSILGDVGLERTAGQDPFLAGLGGALGGGLGGFQAAGGDVGGALKRLGKSLGIPV